MPCIPGSITPVYSERRTGKGAYIVNFEEINSMSGPFTVQKVTVGTTEVVLPSGGNMPRRREIRIFNISDPATTVFIGNATGGVTADMYPIQQNTSITIPMFSHFPIFARTATGSADIRVIEIM
jgi:hypothetical protein